MLADVYETQFARREQRINGILYAGTGDEIRKERFHLTLIGGDHTSQILRNYGRECFRDRKADAFVDQVRRPARQFVPHRSFFGSVVNPCNAELGPEFAQRTIESGY